MGILKELNEIAAKLTGENPKKKTTSQALDYIEKNITNGGGGSSSNVYEINYDMQTGKYSGTIPSNLTIDELINTVFKIGFDFINPETQQTVYITTLLRVVKCFSPEGENLIILSVHYPNDYDISEISYIPSTGEINSQ